MVGCVVTVGAVVAVSIEALSSALSAESALPPVQPKKQTKRLNQSPRVQLSRIAGTPFSPPWQVKY
jgi:hypothetical protein